MCIPPPGRLPGEMKIDRSRRSLRVLENGPEQATLVQNAIDAKVSTWRRSTTWCTSIGGV
jgi:hypothetical protein